MISQSCEIDHSECHCGGGRHTVSQICQARSPDKNLGATDPPAPVNRDRWQHRTSVLNKKAGLCVQKLAASTTRKAYTINPNWQCLSARCRGFPRTKTRLL